MRGEVRAWQDNFGQWKKWVMGLLFPMPDHLLLLFLLLLLLSRVHNPQECAAPDQSLYIVTYIYTYGSPLGGIPSLRHFWCSAMSHADEFF